MKKQLLDRDLIMSFLLIALLAAIAIVFFTFFVLDIEMELYNLGYFAGAISFFTLCVWAVLLIRNC